MTLVRHTDQLFTCAAPLSFMGLRIGTRMTIVKLKDGSLVVHSPVAIDDALRAEVDALGPVAHVIAPNMFHHLYAGQWIEAYPKATLHAPRGLRKKQPGLRIDRDLADATEATFGGELVPIHVDGSQLDETLFLHPASRSLLSSDLTENWHACDHLPTRLYLKANGVWQKPGWPRFLRFIYKDKRATRRSIDELLTRDFDRVILAHGEIIESGGKDAVRGTFAFL